MDRLEKKGDNLKEKIDKKLNTIIGLRWVKRTHFAPKTRRVRSISSAWLSKLFTRPTGDREEEGEEQDMMGDGEEGGKEMEREQPGNSLWTMLGHLFIISTPKRLGRSYANLPFFRPFIKPNWRNTWCVETWHHNYLHPLTLWASEWVLS